MYISVYFLFCTSSEHAQEVMSQLAVITSVVKHCSTKFAWEMSWHLSWHLWHDTFKCHGTYDRYEVKLYKETKNSYPFFAFVPVPVVFTKHSHEVMCWLLSCYCQRWTTPGIHPTRRPSGDTRHLGSRLDAILWCLRRPSSLRKCCEYGKA